MLRYTPKILKNIKLTKRVRCSFDHLVMAPMDTETAVNAVRITDLCFVSWLLPCHQLQRYVNRRYEVETYAVDEDTKTEYGIFTMLCGNNHPLTQSAVDKALEPTAQHSVVSYRVAVTDRMHWHRTNWVKQVHVESKVFGKWAQRAYGVDIRNNRVVIDAEFDNKAAKYSKYNVSVPATGMSLSLEDTGMELLDYRSVTVPGFVENESALRLLAVIPETVQASMGGEVMRCPMWCSAINPNVAKVTNFEPGEQLCTYLNLSKEEFQDPIAAWLQDEVPITILFEPEIGVEQENQEQTMSTEYAMGNTFANRSSTQQIRRWMKFREEVRKKTYADIQGGEEPR